MDKLNQNTTHYNDFGLDITLLVVKLKLTPTKRLIEHQVFMDQLEELQQARVIKTHDQIQRITPSLLST